MTKFAYTWLPVHFARPIRWSYRAFRTILLGRVPQWRLVGGQFYMNLDPKDMVDCAFRFGCYEPALVELIAAIVRPGDVCVDVGAQKGFITLHMAKAAGPTGRVIAFEPDPRAMEILKSNVLHNGFEQVGLHSSALGDSDDLCEFVLSHQLGWSSRFPNDVAKCAVASTTAVRTRRLDDVVGDLGIAPGTDQLSLIKIDAEGSEPLVLQGARQTLQSFRPAIHIEVNTGSLSAGGSSPQSIEDFLRPLGYEFYAVELRRTGRLVRRKLCLSPLESLTFDMGACEDVLAINSSNRTAPLLARLMNSSVC